MLVQIAVPYVNFNCYPCSFMSAVDPFLLSLILTEQKSLVTYLINKNMHVFLQRIYLRPKAVGIVL